jgi:hypothetical protein
LAHKKLVLALRGYKDSRLKDLRQMTENQHTCKNEQLNNVHNIYMPKHTFFGPEQVEFFGFFVVFSGFFFFFFFFGVFYIFAQKREVDFFQ